MRSRRFETALVSCLAGAALLACRPAAPAAFAELAPIETDWLSFRVLVEGQPLPRTEVQVTKEERRSGSTCSSGSGPMHTDETGRLRCELGSFEPSGLTEFEMTVVHGNLYGKLRGRRMGGESTAGDLVLEPMPILTAGRVIDLEGTVVSDAEVLAVDAARLQPPRGVTDERGEFALRVPGVFGAQHQRIFARHGNRLSPLMPVEVGAVNVTLTLSSVTGGLMGRVLVDPEIPPARIAVQLYASELGFLQTGHGLFELQARPDASGTFSLAGRIPGRHRARILVDSHSLLTLDDVFVEPGTPRTDPRLDPLDLRGRIHARRIRLVVPEGAAEPQGQYLVLCTGLDGAYASFEGSELLVFSPDPDPDVQIFAEGFRIVRLERVREDRSVHLQAGWPVRLVLDDEIALPELPVTWSVMLLGQDRALTFWSRPIRFDPGQREARGVAADVGELEVGWIRRPGGADELPEAFGMRGGQRGWPRQTVVVRDVPEEQVLRLGWVPVAR